MSSTTVHVKNISSQTSEKEVRDFFSFCGKISNISVTQSGSSKSAAVTFEKPTAAKTALLLDNTQLGPSLVSVTAAASTSHDDSVSSSNEKGTSFTGSGSTTGPTATTGGNDEEVDQEDKPRSRIVAEYLAHGYALSDNVISRALTLDQQHGYSSRFTSALQQFDAKYHATDNAKQLDARLGVTEKAGSAWQGLNSYFEKAMGTPSGQKVREFYNGGSQQVLDVHNEAKRLAGLKSGSGNNKAYSTAGGVGEGYEGQKCNCGAELGKCPCVEGKCSCASCPKNTGAMGGDEKAQYV